MAQSVPVLTNADVEAADMGVLVELMIGCLKARAAGKLAAPPRHLFSFEGGALVFTIGAQRDDEGGAAGLRTYGQMKTAEGGERSFTAVWDLASGSLKGFVVGEALGAWRTGAIGGAALALMTRLDAERLVLLGAGQQAETQLRAAVAARPNLKTIEVFSRRADSNEAFATRMAAELKREIAPLAAPRAAIEAADIVICATNSAAPVFETDWLKPGAHVTTINARSPQVSDIPLDLVERVDFAGTDGMEQLRAMPAFPLGVDFVRDRVIDLADVASGGMPVIVDRGIGLFISVGLAGTEVAVARHLLGF